MPSDLNFFYKYVCKQILRWPVITYVTLNRCRGGWQFDGVKVQRDLHLEPNQITFLLVTFWQNTLTPVSVSTSVSFASLKVSIYFCFLLIALWKGKIPILSDACKTPSVIKHHIANEKYPTLKRLSYNIQSDFSKRVKAKPHIKLPADKGGGIVTDSVLLTLLTALRSHTDFAQRFPHPTYRWVW